MSGATDPRAGTESLRGLNVDSRPERQPWRGSRSCTRSLPPRSAWPRFARAGQQLAFAITEGRVKGSTMASDAMKQAIDRLERAMSRAEALARQIAQERSERIEAQFARDSGDDDNGPAVDIDPFSRDKAIAALKSLDALIGDLQKARSEA
jgi:ribosomal protein L4